MAIFADNIFWLKNKLFRTWAYRAYEESMQFDSLSAEEKTSIEFERMKSLVKYAYEHVSYYKFYYDSKGFHPSMLVCWEDWEKVPILEKDVIRFSVDELISDEYEKKDLIEVSTSGSTGTPLKVYKERRNVSEVMGWRAMKWWRMSPSDNMAKLHRKAANTIIGKIKNRMLWWPTRRVYLNSSLIITDDMIRRFLLDLNKYKIRWIQGYSSTIEKVADYMLKYKVCSPTIEMIWWTSAPLSSMMRKKIEAAYNCRVMNQYGCNEMWNIAIQKKDEPYLTVCNDFVHVDTISENGKQTKKNVDGDILITDLRCKAYPLIKYRLGDRGSFAEESSKSTDGYPKLNFVKGRISDNILLPNGRTVDGIYLTAICDVCVDTISSYQIYQAKDYSVSLKLVLREGVKKENKEVLDLCTTFEKLLCNTVVLTVEFLDTIPPVKGKKRYIISELA